MRWSCRCSVSRWAPSALMAEVLPHRSLTRGRRGWLALISGPLLHLLHDFPAQLPPGAFSLLTCSCQKGLDIRLGQEKPQTAEYAARCQAA